MRINLVNNQQNTNFGINYLNKAIWNKNIVKTIESSQLVKDIDKKYPDAFIKYSKSNMSNFDFANDEPDYMASLVIGLTKNKIFTFRINSHTSEGADSALNRYVSILSLEEVEKACKSEVENVKYSFEVAPKSSNQFIKFASRIYHFLINL